MKIGSHVGNSGREMLVGSINEALSYNANCLMFYLGAPQNAYRRPINEFNIDEFQSILKKHGFTKNEVIIHAPYIVNLAQSDDEKRKHAIDIITKDVKMAYEVGALSIVIHPGAHVGVGIDKGIELISDSLKQIIDNTKDTDVILALETMAGKGTECCSDFTQIKHIIDNVNNERVKVCFDTCHVFDSGYDIVNNYDEVVEDFDRIVGIDKIQVIHLNDSKNELGEHKDRHENIGFGKIGFDTLLKFATDSRFINVPKILETPYMENDIKVKIYAPYKFEIAMLKEGKFNPNLYDDVKNSYL